MPCHWTQRDCIQARCSEGHYAYLTRPEECPFWTQEGGALPPLLFKRDAVNREREYIEHDLAFMAEGQEIVISAELFERAYPCGWPSIYNTHREAFLSSRIGSAWGAWTCEQLFRSGDYRVGRHKEGPKLVYCDPDRDYLYDRLPSGELVPRKS